MKKIIALFLVIVTCVSVFACGNSNPATTTATTTTTAATTTVATTATATTAANTTSNTTATTTPPATTAPDIVLNLNEKAIAGNFEITVTDVRIVERFTVNNTSYGLVGGSDYKILVMYTLKYIGKTSCYISDRLTKLEYSDGYVFDTSKMFHNSFGPDIIKLGGYSDLADFKALSEEQYFMSSFTVPKMVGDNKDEDLKIVFSSSMLGVTDSDVYYNIRPIDDVRIEALYQQALALAASKDYALAMDKLDEIGEYKDSKAVYDECMKQWAVREGLFYEKSKEYLNNNSDKFELVTNAELVNMMVETWKLSVGSTSWIFNEDGTIDDGWGNDRWWSIEGDTLILKTDKKSNTLTVKRVCKDGYILYTESGEIYSTMYLPS